MFTFKEKQGRSRASVASFFQCDDKAMRLKRFSEHGVLNVVSFFLSPHYNHVNKLGAAPVHLNEEYKAAMSNLKKRYFDFTSQAGKGELVWEGQRNPEMTLVEGVSLPLPSLVALKWFIESGFDRLFWQDYEHTKRTFDAHFTKVKLKYTETHKNKKKAARERIAREVVASSIGQHKGRKKVTLTRIQRNMISARLLAERREHKEKRKQLRLTGRKKNNPKRPRVQSQACAFVLKK